MSTASRKNARSSCALSGTVGRPSSVFMLLPQGMPPALAQIPANRGGCRCFVEFDFGQEYSSTAALSTALADHANCKHDAAPIRRHRHRVRLRHRKLGPPVAVHLWPMQSLMQGPNRTAQLCIRSAYSKAASRPLGSLVMATEAIHPTMTSAPSHAPTRNGRGAAGLSATKPSMT